MYLDALALNSTHVAKQAEQNECVLCSLLVITSGFLIYHLKRVFVAHRKIDWIYLLRNRMTIKNQIKTHTRTHAAALKKEIAAIQYHIHTAK